MKQIQFFFALTSLSLFTSCSAFMDESNCTTKKKQYDFNARIVDTKGNPLTIKGAVLGVTTNSSYFPISSSSELISDNEGKFSGKLIVGKHDCDAPSGNPKFIVPTIDGYFYSHDDLSLETSTFIAYAKKNYMKLTIVNTDTLVGLLDLHSHVGKNFASGFAEIIKIDEPVLIDFKKGMTQTIVIPSVRNTESYFHTKLLDNSITRIELKNSIFVNNNQSLFGFIFPSIDRDTVAYTFVIK